MFKRRSSLQERARARGRAKVRVKVKAKARARRRENEKRKARKRAKVMMRRRKSRRQPQLPLQLLVQQQHLVLDQQQHLRLQQPLCQHRSLHFLHPASGITCPSNLHGKCRLLRKALLLNQNVIVSDTQESPCVAVKRSLQQLLQKHMLAR